MAIAVPHLFDLSQPSVPYIPRVVKLATRVWNITHLRREILSQVCCGFNPSAQLWVASVMTVDKTTCAEMIYWRYRCIRYSQYPWKYLDIMPEWRKEAYKNAVVGILLRGEFPRLIREDTVGFEGLLSYFPNLVHIRAAWYHLRRVDKSIPKYTLDVHADEFKMGPNGIETTILPPEDLGFPGVYEWRYHLRFTGSTSILNAYLEHWVHSHVFRLPKCFDRAVASLTIDSSFSPEPWTAVLARRTSRKLPPIPKVQMPPITMLSQLHAFGEAAGKHMKDLYLTLIPELPYNAETIFNYPWHIKFPELKRLRFDLIVRSHPQPRDFYYRETAYSSLGWTLTPPLYGCPEEFIREYGNRPLGVERFKLVLFIRDPVLQPELSGISPHDLVEVQRAVDDIAYALPDPRLIANAVGVDTEFNIRLLLSQHPPFIGVTVGAVYYIMLRRFLANNVVYGTETDYGEEEERTRWVKLDEDELFWRLA